MSGRPTNAAVEFTIEALEFLNEVTEPSAVRPRVAPDFQYEDRRHGVNFGTIGVEGFPAFLATIPFTSPRPHLSLAEVVAVRGERLCMTRLRFGYPDGSVVEFLECLELDDTLRRVRRMIDFDPDDITSALHTLGELQPDAPEAHDGREVRHG